MEDESNDDEDFKKNPIPLGDENLAKIRYLTLNEYERYLNITTRLPSDQRVPDEGVCLSQMSNDGDDETLNSESKKRRQENIDYPEDDEEQYEGSGKPLSTL